MVDIDITVAEVRQPEPGKKTGKIKATDGKVWYVWADKIHEFFPGGSYKITDYSTYRTDRGATLYTIKAYQALSSNGAASRQGNSAVSRPQMQPSVGPVSNNEHRMDIFICGAINNMLSNTNVDPMALTMMDMVDAIHKFRSAWLAVFGPSPLPRQQTARPDPISSGTQTAQQGTIQHNDMDDEIPF